MQLKQLKSLKKKKKDVLLGSVRSQLASHKTGKNGRYSWKLEWWRVVGGGEEGYMERGRRERKYKVQTIFLFELPSLLAYKNALLAND